jgi:2-polyprenyl-3-methyl-5-hydroxy-6-metoxy-1,4-benzoquinol methylase
MAAWYENLPGSESRKLIDAILGVWPEHAGFLERSFAGRSAAELLITERLAELVVRLHPDDLPALAAGYRWMCEMVLEEDLDFKRSGHYRYSSFKQVDELVYQQRERMAQYMLGLLISSVLWANHTRSFAYYVGHFLASNSDGYAHLEVGPGHGLLLYLAASDPRCASVTGLDISAESLSQTQGALTRLGTGKPAACLACDIAQPLDIGQRYDSVVISEVCEHLEDPETALRNLRGFMRPGGRIFVNMPINAPAIDHIFLLRSPEEVLAMVERAGFEIEASMNAPTSGYTEARARKLGASISVCVIGRAPVTC